MSRHLNLLKTIFQEPVSTNIHWREVEALLHHLGANPWRPFSCGTQ
jgi:hypothetical protein